jgi:hypothetical protein
MDGRDLVPEEALRVRQLAICLGDASFARKHEPVRDGCVRSEPATAAPDRADQRPCLVRVDTSDCQLSAVDRDECKRRPGERVSCA